MRSLHRLVVASATAVTLITGLLAAAPSAAQADGSTPIVGMLTRDGAVERGTQVNLTGLVDSGESVPSEGWWLDGHPMDDLTVGDDGGNVYLQDPPGLSAGQYSRDDVVWDTTTAADGPHTLTYWVDVYDGSSYSDTTYQVTANIVVNNAPIGMLFSDGQKAVVHGATHQLGVAVQAQGSPVKSVSFSGDLVPPLQRIDNLAPYTAMLDVLDAKNGPHTVVVTAHDSAGVVTTKRLTLNVHNVSALTVTGPSTADVDGSITIHIKSTARFPSGQKLLIQQKLTGSWTTVEKVTLPSSGRKDVTNYFRTVGRKYLRVATASTSFWPGTSKAYTVRVDAGPPLGD